MDRAPLTRQSLLIELARHSDEAWSEFIEVYEGAVAGYCRALGLQEADALDATQEVFAAVHGRIASWDARRERGSFRAWLFRVARNVSIDVLADRRRRAALGGTQGALAIERVSDDASGDPASLDAASFDRAVERALLAAAAARVRREVRATTWLAFERTAVEGRAAAEVARELGSTVGSVHTAKCRVVARIRAHVALLSGTHREGAEPRER